MSASVFESASPAPDEALERHDDGAAILLRMSDVQPRPVTWLWAGRIPFGKMTLLDGDPSLGKSQITIDIAARVTTGRAMPGEGKGTTPGGAVFLSCEDDPADTIRPRLDAAKADPSRVVLLTGVRALDGDGLAAERMPRLSDLTALRDAIASVDARLVVIDPLMAYLGGDSHRDQEVRQNLAPLASLAAETGVAVLVVRHLNKSGGGNAMYRGGGSIGIIAAARSALLVAPDPDDADRRRRVLVAVKHNLCAEPDALAYHIDVSPDGVPRIAWEGRSDCTASQLLAVPEDGDERSALEEAKQWITDLLSRGPRPTTEVEAEARRHGISTRTLRRARTELGIAREKDGQGPWILKLAALAPFDKPAQNGDPQRYYEGGQGGQTASAAPLATFEGGAGGRPGQRTLDLGVAP